MYFHSLFHLLYDCNVSWHCVPSGLSTNGGVMTQHTIHNIKRHVFFLFFFSVSITLAIVVLNGFLLHPQLFKLFLNLYHCALTL